MTKVYSRTAAIQPTNSPTKVDGHPHFVITLMIFECLIGIPTMFDLENVGDAFMSNNQAFNCPPWLMRGCGEASVNYAIENR